MVEVVKVMAKVVEEVVQVMVEWVRSTHGKTPVTNVVAEEEVWRRWHPAAKSHHLQPRCCPGHQRIPWGTR